MSSEAGDGVNLAISLCLTYIICISCLRIWIRRGAFGVDDAVIAVATLLTFGHTAVDYVALSAGLGKSWRGLEDEGKLKSLNAAIVAGVVTFVVALYLSKCAMISFLTRITKAREELRIYLYCNILVAFNAIISLLVVTAGCASSDGYYWSPRDSPLARCPGQTARWQAFTALDIVTEAILLALPVRLVWGLQMPRARKTMILGAFWLRIPVLAFTLLRNQHTLALRYPSPPAPDPGTTSSRLTIWLEVHLAYALAASTLAASKHFTESFNSDFGLGFARGSSIDANTGGSGGSGGKSSVGSGSADSHAHAKVRQGTGGSYALGDVSDAEEAYVRAQQQRGGLEGERWMGRACNTAGHGPGWNGSRLPSPSSSSPLQLRPDVEPGLCGAHFANVSSPSGEEARAGARSPGLMTVRSVDEFEERDEEERRRDADAPSEGTGRDSESGRRGSEEDGGNWNSHGCKGGIRREVECVVWCDQAPILGRG